MIIKTSDILPEIFKNRDRNPDLRVSEALWEAKRKFPFFAPLSFKLMRVPPHLLHIYTTLFVTPSLELCYNPVFVSGIKDSELVGCIVHEVMHIALNHFKRADNIKSQLDEYRRLRGGKEYTDEEFRRILNYAADFEVNSEINRLKNSIKGFSDIELPQGVLDPVKFNLPPNRVMEQYAGDAVRILESNADRPPDEVPSPPSYSNQAQWQGKAEQQGGRSQGGQQGGSGQGDKNDQQGDGQGDKKDNQQGGQGGQQGDGQGDKQDNQQGGQGGDQGDKNDQQWGQQGSQQGDGQGDKKGDQQGGQQGGSGQDYSQKYIMSPSADGSKDYLKDFPNASVVPNESVRNMLDKVAEAYDNFVREHLGRGNAPGSAVESGVLDQIMHKRLKSKRRKLLDQMLSRLGGFITISRTGKWDKDYADYETPTPLSRGKQLLKHKIRKYGTPVRIVIDVSGSMLGKIQGTGQTYLSVAYDLVLGVLKKLGMSNVTVTMADVGLVDIDTEELKKTLMGSGEFSFTGGGTDMSKAIHETVGKMREEGKKQYIIVLTDGITDWPTNNDMEKYIKSGVKIMAVIIGAKGPEDPVLTGIPPNLPHIYFTPDMLEEAIGG